MDASRVRIVERSPPRVAEHRGDQALLTRNQVHAERQLLDLLGDRGAERIERRLVARGECAAELHQIDLKPIRLGLNIGGGSQHRRDRLPQENEIVRRHALPEPISTHLIQECPALRRPVICWKGARSFRRSTLRRAMAAASPFANNVSADRAARGEPDRHRKL